MMLARNVETFLGCDSCYRTADIVLYGAPFDSTTSFRPGARFGPSAIRHESFGLETYSPYQNADLTGFDIFDSGDLELCFGSAESALNDIESRAAEILRDNKLPLLLGGEHLVTLGAVRAVLRRFPDLHIVHFDAHADLRQHYLGAQLSHASVLRRCHDLLGDGRIHQFCIRSGEREEFAFATNFNPEVNLREVSAPGSYWEDGRWVEVPAMSIKREYDFDQVGRKEMYLLHHEEIESLAKNIPEARRIRFFMTFGQSYLDHMRCLEDVGMLSTVPVEFEGRQIVPIQFLKALLPDPASLGPRTHGKTNIGCIFTGKKDGKDKTWSIYNVCDHQECYREVKSQAISYTTGVPAMCGALMLLTGQWAAPGVHTVEEFDPDPFLEALDRYGLPRRVNRAPALVDG